MNEKNSITSPITINEHLCNGCGKCVFTCPMGVIDISNKPVSGNKKTAIAAKPEYCMTCEACVIVCKRSAVTLNPET